MKKRTGKVYRSIEEVKEKTRKKEMTCLSGKAKGCKKKFITVPERRICSVCTDLIDSSNMNGGYNHAG